MAVIHDVMPAFLLLQPGSLADAQKLLEQQGTDAWILAGVAASAAIASRIRFGVTGVRSTARLPMAF